MSKKPFAVLIVVLLSLFTILSLSGFSEAHATVGAGELYTSAEGMALLEVSTGRVLYQKNMHKKRAPASTTKILTAITVIENTEELDKVKKIPDAAVGVEGSSIYLECGEELSTRDLLYGLMLQSGNDCAESLAILTSGSKDQFATLMNTTAKRIGAKNSNFVTPHGLDAPDHYTTAYDLALISAYALKNPIFSEIAATKKHSAPWKGRDYNRVIINKNKLLNSFEGCDGVKTGYTKKSGRCLVSSATRDGMRVVCAVLNCGPMFEDCARLMDASFYEFKMTEILKKGENLARLTVSDSRKESVACGVLKKIEYPLRLGEIPALKFIAETKEHQKAPVPIGMDSGIIKTFLANELLFEEKLYTIESAESLTLFDRLKDIAGQWMA